MNKHNTTLPSISHLLNSTRNTLPSPPLIPPALSLSPPSPRSLLPPSPPYRLSPLPSPIDSCSAPFQYSPRSPSHSLPPPGLLLLDEISLSPVRHAGSSKQQPAVAPRNPPPAQIFLSSTGQPILRRRRGRPRNDGDWTFLTPTVWDVKTSSSPQEESVSSEEEDNDDNKSTMEAAFTSAKMDTVLEMPRKKRGRKPKTQIAGNSCFVWRSNKKQRH